MVLVAQLTGDNVAAPVVIQLYFGFCVKYMAFHGWLISCCVQVVVYWLSVNSATKLPWVVHESLE